MSKSIYKKLIISSGAYSLTSVIGMFIGLVSLPLLTNNLTVAEYGVLSLCTTIIGFVSGFNKLGVQHGGARVLHDYWDTDRSNFLLMYYVTYILIFLLFTIQISMYFTFTDFIDPKFKGVLLVSLIISLFMASRSILNSLFVATEKAFTVSALGIISKILQFFLLLVVLKYYYPDTSAEKVLYSILLSEVVVTTLVIMVSRKNKFFDFSNRTLSFYELLSRYKSLLIYGLPFYAWELSSWMHAFSDRFLIQYYLDSEQVGLYSVPHRLSTITQEVVTGGIAIAITPIFLRYWREEGNEKVSYFLYQCSQIFMAIFPFLILASFSYSETIILILANEKYTPYALVFPISLLGLLLASFTFIYGAGMTIAKDSKSLFRFTFESVLINIAVNLLLIPELGPIAAAWSTLISNSWLLFRIFNKSKNYLYIGIPLKQSVINIACGALVYLIVHQISFDSGVIGLLVSGLIALLLYIIFIYVFNHQLRNIVNVLINKVIIKDLK